MQPELKYQYPLGSEPLHDYPGGQYKAASASTFPISSAISGGLVILKPGGMRKLHWRPVDEWAIVINSSCRELLVGYDSSHPSESWDWHTGDVWGAK